MTHLPVYVQTEQHDRALRIFVHSESFRACVRTRATTTVQRKLGVTQIKYMDACMENCVRNESFRCACWRLRKHETLSHSRTDNTQPLSITYIFCLSDENDLQSMFRSQNMRLHIHKRNIHCSINQASQDS